MPPTLPVRPASWVPSSPFASYLLQGSRRASLGMLVVAVDPSLSQLLGSLPTSIQTHNHHSITLDIMLTKFLDHRGCCLGTSSTMSCVDWHASQFSPTTRRSSIGILLFLLCRLPPDHGPTSPTQRRHLFRTRTTHTRTHNRSLDAERHHPNTYAASYCAPMASLPSPPSNWPALPHTIPAVSSCRLCPRDAYQSHPTASARVAYRQLLLEVCV